MQPDPITIVLVEDDPGHAKLIQKNLERAGISNNLVHFIDGQQVLDYFAEKTQDEIVARFLILLDLNLPVIDGFEVLDSLKKDPRTNPVPVVILTTTDNPREIDRCYSLGCNIYLTKPIGYDSFCDAIRKLGMMLAVVQVPHANVKDKI